MRPTPKPAPRQRLRLAAAPTAPRSLRRPLRAELPDVHVDGAPDEILDQVTGPFPRGRTP